MKHSAGIVVLGVVAALFLSGCKTQYEAILSGNDMDLKYKTAMDCFSAGKYGKAAQLFESMTMLTTGTERDDSVQYYWGLSNYLNKDYYTAEANFENFVSKFPRSVFLEPAMFYRIDCMYRQTLRYELDQRPTYKAMSAMGEYLAQFPEGEHSDLCRDMLETLGNRLDRKAYENARLYYKMEDYKAARVAFKNVLKEDAENIYREDILYYSAMSSYKYAELSVKSKQKERFLVFQDDYLNFIGEYPESKYRKELDTLYKKVKEKN